MVDFSKLSHSRKKSNPVDPFEIFRRLPKPAGINDLYSSQAEVLRSWTTCRDSRDTVIKLHTGGGKTLVGLLIGQSTLNEINQPVLYLTPTVQLVKQTAEKARDVGIPVVTYVAGEPLDERFLNSEAIMIASYKALFNGRSRFGLRSYPSIQRVAAVILDDAHAAFSVVRDSFTLELKNDKKSHDTYRDLAYLFRSDLNELKKIGLFDDIMEGNDNSVLEIPYWAWREKKDVVREFLRARAEDFPLIWPLLRDKLHLCHALLTRKSFSITPFLPTVNMFPTFFEARRRIYMSASSADDSELIRTFGASFQSVKNPLISKSLAGISERMILVPDLMAFEEDPLPSVKELMRHISATKCGSVILVPSESSAEAWKDSFRVARGSEEVEKAIDALQQQRDFGPFVFANRYDGIDLPGDSCRVLVFSGVPIGTSDYEMYRASCLYAGASLTRLIAQRIEQGIGRGARGAGDHCIVLLIGRDLSSWVCKRDNLKFLTSATKAQLYMGLEISREVTSTDDLLETVRRSLQRDKDWLKYHAETLAELIEEESIDETEFSLARAERQAFDLWADGQSMSAIEEIKSTLKESDSLDSQTRGWIEQFAAMISDQAGHSNEAQRFQQKAFSHNRNLHRSRGSTPYSPIASDNSQAAAIVKVIGEYAVRSGLIIDLEDIGSKLNPSSSPNMFEKALADLGKMIGFSSDRCDERGEGPDVIWLLPNKTGLVIEAKSRKDKKNPLTKKEHGQLLVAAEWFGKNYPDYSCIRVSMHPNNEATKAANAEESFALTYEKLALVVYDAKVLFEDLCTSQLTGTSLVNACNSLLTKSSLKSDSFVRNYLSTFVAVAE